MLGSFYECAVCTVGPMSELCSRNVKIERYAKEIISVVAVKLKKYEWDSAEESLYEKKTTSQHERNCRKIWDSKKGKEHRKHFIRTNGKIPIMYKAQLDPLFEV